MYPTYQFLRPAIIFATVITTLQSLAWICMTITGIVAYYCNLDVTTDLNAEGLLGLTFFRLYFQGECTPPGFPTEIFSVLDEVQTLTPLDVHAWMWVYLCVSFMWFVSGLLLIAFVNKKNMKFANIYLYFWIINTVTVLVLDVVVGSFFAKDYHNLSVRARTVILSESVERVGVIIAARTAAWIMLEIAFRGFVVWVINGATVIYLFSHTFHIHDHNKVKSGFTNNAFVNDNGRRSPTVGFDPFTPKPWYSGGEGDTARTAEIPRVHQDARLNNRALSLNLYSVDDNKRYSPQKEYSPERRYTPEPKGYAVHPSRYSSQDPRQQVSTNYLRPNVQRSDSGDNTRKSNVPRPDYSPTMPRALKVQNNIMDDDNSLRSGRSGRSGLRRY